VVEVVLCAVCLQEILLVLAGADEAVALARPLGARAEPRQRGLARGGRDHRRRACGRLLGSGDPAHRVVTVRVRHGARRQWLRPARRRGDHRREGVRAAVRVRVRDVQPAARGRLGEPAGPNRQQAQRAVKINVRRSSPHRSQVEAAARGGCARAGSAGTHMLLISPSCMQSSVLSICGRRPMGAV
jgi:hypothetical protein